MSHNSTMKVDQKEYLKKYLSGDKIKKKKKKDKKYDRDAHAKVRVIDDDALAYRADMSDDDLLLTGEDAPQIVGEYIETDSNGNGGKKWRSIAEASEKVQIKREKSPTSRWGQRCDHKEIKNEFSPKREYRNKTLDMLPPRKRERNVNPFKAKLPDLSPPRSGGRLDRSADISPHRSNPFKKTARGRSSSADLSPPRTIKRKNSMEKGRGTSSADISPPRLNPFRQRASGQDVNQGRHRKGGSQTISRETYLLSRSPRRNHSPTRPSCSSIDLSPPRRRADSRSPHKRDKSSTRRMHNPFVAKRSGSRQMADLSPSRKLNRNSPLRNQRKVDTLERNSFERPENRRQNGSSNDRYRSISSGSSSQRRRENSRQFNPPRSIERSEKSFSTARNQERIRFGHNYQSRHSPDNRQKQRSPPRGCNSDQSPTRRRLQSSPQRSVSPRFNRQRRSHSKEHKRTRWGISAAPKNRYKGRNRSESPPPTHKPKASKTLDGKKAGLQHADALKEETEARRREEDRLFEKMSTDLSGRDAEVAVRSTGRRGKRDNYAKPEDPEKLRRKEEREKQKKEQYDRWGMGLKQVEDHRARLEEQAYESNKPLARYSNDADLEKHLREQERVDDPMLVYMRRKKKEQLKDSRAPQKPVYEGSYPENRFGIRPGYRWDGVDRSNGYEKKWFDVQNAKRAGQEEAYKYSVEDM